MHDERLLDRSMMARLLGLLSSDRFASEMSAVTRVIVILSNRNLLCIPTLSPVTLTILSDVIIPANFRKHTKRNLN